MEMEYRLELKPFEGKKGDKCKVIQITDIALHTSKKKPTFSVGKKFKQAFSKNEPGRVYAPVEHKEQNERRMAVLDMVQNDPEFIRMVQEEQKNGYRVLLALPSDGIPVVAGKDTIEFMNSKNGKRIIRGLAKNKPST